MADIKLPASADFFKHLSREFQQLRFIIQVLDNFAFQALDRRYDYERPYVLYILEQLEVLIIKTQQLKDEVEKTAFVVKG